MNAREEILARVRAGVGKGNAAVRRGEAEAYLSACQQGPQPAAMGDLVARFRSKAESLASTVACAAGAADVPQVVADFLVGHGLAPRVVLTPDCAAYPWRAAGISFAARSAVDTDLVGISGCFCAIAETGTLMLLSGESSPATVSLLPETHIALVPESRIVATMEDAFALLRHERGLMPRAINFVSGPSRTGDIEQTIVLGAHGPCRVHLILIGEST